MEAEILVILSERMIERLTRFYPNKRAVLAAFEALNPKPTDPAEIFRSLSGGKGNI